MIDDVDDPIIVSKPSRAELGRFLCDLLLRYRYIKKLRYIARNIGISISDKMVSTLLKEYCPDLYYHIRKENIKRHFFKVIGRR